jgi:hypothetical protein
MTRKPKHNSFYMDIDGEPVHMQANPNMSPETEAALVALVRAARKMLDAIPLYTCSKCGEERARAAGGVCTQCRIGELWK